MNKGNIVESGPMDVILSHPREPDTRTFIEGGLLI
jgi:ABC-type oligopeptide transport system ATPase subunit